MYYVLLLLHSCCYYSLYYYEHQTQRQEKYTILFHGMLWVVYKFWVEKERQLIVKRRPETELDVVSPIIQLDLGKIARTGTYSVSMLVMGQMSKGMISKQQPIGRGQPGDIKCGRMYSQSLRNTVNTNNVNEFYYIEYAVPTYKHGLSIIIVNKLYRMKI